LLLRLPTSDGRLDLDRLPEWYDEYLRRFALPLLELYTDGLLTDSTLLDAYLTYLDALGDTPPGGDTPSPVEGEP